LATLFYGWRVVGVCFVAAVLTWGFGVFGASVYLAEVTRAQSWSVSLVSVAVTAYYISNALSLSVIGGAIDRFGSRPVFIFGALALGGGVAWIGHVAETWQLFGAFIIMGLGYASLSLTSLSATIAPWFERHQGRSVAIALTGASVGAILIVPLLVTTIEQFGFQAALSGGGCLIVALLVPLSLIILRHRNPRDLGLGRDGDALTETGIGASKTAPGPHWTRRRAIRSAALWSISIAFALALTTQVGFLVHHLNLAAPVLGVSGAAWLVSVTGMSAFIGRLLLVRIADSINLRRYTSAILATQALVFGLIAIAPGTTTLICGSLIFGFCQGQITTLSPIIVRREFRAVSYGAIYGFVATVIQFSSAFGPMLFGALRDLLGGYGPVLLVAAGLELVAVIAIFCVRSPRLEDATDTPD
jgi:MFS family permease